MSTTTQGFLFFQIAVAGDKSGDGVPRGTFSIRPCSTRWSRMESISSWSRCDKLNGFCFRAEKSVSSLKGTGIETSQFRAEKTLIFPNHFLNPFSVFQAPMIGNLHDQLIHFVE